jgi:hypothetical protein
LLKALALISTLSGVEEQFLSLSIDARSDYPALAILPAVFIFPEILLTEK